MYQPQNDTLNTTPFYSILLKCWQGIKEEDKKNFTAEMKILAEYNQNGPKFHNENVNDWILKVEQSTEDIQMSDIDSHIQQHFDSMPLGFEKGALNPYIIDSTDHT